MLRIKESTISNILFKVLYVFIAIDIVNGAGKVPGILEKLYSLFLATFYALLILSFIISIKRKANLVQGLVLSMMLWQLIVTFTNPSTMSLNMLYQITGWPLLFYIVYDLTKRGKFTLPDLKPFFFLWIAASIYVVYILRTQTFNDMYRTYYLIAAVPFYLYKQDKWKYIRLLSTIAIILITYKRTAFAALFAGLAVYYICDVYIQRKKFQKYKKTFMLVIAIITVGIILYYNFDNLAVIRRMKRIFSDNGSDRFTIWATLLSHYKEQGLLYKLIGNGYEGCRMILNNAFAAAHNDFVEILMDYGAVGVMFLLAFLCTICRYFFLSFKKRLPDTPGFAYIFIVLLFFMLFSFAMWQSILMKLIAIYLAYLIANYKCNIN